MVNSSFPSSFIQCAYYEVDFTCFACDKKLAQIITQFYPHAPSKWAERAANTAQVQVHEHSTAHRHQAILPDFMKLCSVQNFVKVFR